MIIAVTGASGYLGKNLVRKIIEKTDNNILAITSNITTFANQKDNERIKVVRRDDFETIKKEKMDVLINCAFPRNENGIELAKGLKYIKEIFEIVSKSGVKAIINISSQSVYDSKRQVPAKESELLNLETKYAVAKYSSELLTDFICKKINHTNIRLASLIGPGFDQRVVNKMIKIAIEKRELTALDGNLKYGFMDIDDAIDGILKIITHSNVKFREVYNLGTAKYYSLVDIANKISDCLKIHNYNILVNKKTTEKIYNSSLDVNLFYTDFKFNAKISLDESIEKIYRQIIKESSDQV